MLNSELYFWWKINVKDYCKIEVLLTFAEKEDVSDCKLPVANPLKYDMSKSKSASSGSK